jgi:uncharacterized protein (TIGR02996 family)
MLDDQEFIDAVLAKPQDDTIRLVYADWLDERGDVRGEFLRLSLERVRHTFGSRKYAEVSERLEVIRPQINPRWVDAIIRPNQLGFEWSNGKFTPKAVLLIDRERFGPVLSGEPIDWLYRKADSVFVEVPTGQAARRQVIYDLWAEVRVGDQTVTWSNFGAPIAHPVEGCLHRTGTFVFRREDYTRTLEAARRKCWSLHYQLTGFRRRGDP